MRATRCPTCRAQIILVQTYSSGLWMPINANPHPRGTITLTHDGLAKVVSAGDGPHTRYRPHLATCKPPRKETP